MDSKISDLTDGGAARTTDDIPVTRTGANVRVRPKLLNVATTAITRTAVETDDVVECTGATATTQTLPDATTLPAGKQFTIKRLGTSNITIDTNGGNIDGAATYVLTAQYDALSVYVNAAQTGYSIY